MRANRYTTLALNALVLATLAVACAKKESEPVEPEPPEPATPSLVDRFGDHAVFAAFDFAAGSLSFTTAAGEATPARTIRELDLPDSHMVLLPSRAGRRGAVTVGELGEAGTLELAKPCSTKLTWLNETVVFDVQVCVGASDAALLEEALEGQPLATSFSGPLRNQPGSSALRCVPSTISVTGVIVCKNTCGSGGFVCELNVGSEFFARVEQPVRDADLDCFRPCNNLNPCTPLCEQE